MKILAVDYGDVRTGLAVCDEMEILASPLGVITQRQQPLVVEAVAEQVKACGARAIVVGYPLNMDGSAGERAQKCRELAELLKEKTGLAVELWDERCTTVSAHKALNVTNTRGKKRKSVVDQVAAVMILQSFLEHKRLTK